MNLKSKIIVIFLISVLTLFILLVDNDDYKTFHSELDFSFQYPKYMTVMLASLPGDNYRLIVSPNNNSATGKIIVSVALNDEKITPEQWLLGPTSGFDTSQKYLEIKIDGEDAVQTDGGTWTVVNTPDNKWRISIADLTLENEVALLVEIGIVVSTFDF